MKRFLFLTSIIGLAACNSSNHEMAKEETKDSTTVVKVVDEHSYSNVNDVYTTHLHLNLTADFENHVLKGSVTHDIENLTESNEIIFDINGETIEKVELNEGESAEFSIEEGGELLGDALKVKINENTTQVTIFYQTSPDAEALQWLNPQQTAGKTNPYLFTQGEAILTRTWLPCQDSPSNRITYSAEINCPKELMAVMSADNPTEKSKDGHYEFEMKQAIPSYLIALAIGDLEFAPLGGRTGVYTEPTMLHACVNEFTDVESMVEAAEELYGEYKWGRYDIIVLPPSFPFGGMENPRLTFATPTIIAGDKSLVSLIAHELAHSWSGNLVTNATWDDFWLNEGFTVYFENRIMEKLYGKERADMLMSIEYQELLHENHDILEGEHPEDTHLKLDLDGRNPDDGMTSIAYVKGALFLKTIEKEVGREKFDAFLNQYFKDHQFETMTTEQFLSYLNTELFEPNHVEFNTDEWVYEKGIPNNCVKIESDRFKIVDEKAAQLTQVKSVSELGIVDSAWTTQEWMRFIREIPEDLSIDMFKQLDDQFNLSRRGNSEIMAEWYVKSIHAGYKGINQPMEDFLMHVGRRKFLEPIYTALAETPENLELARSIYAKARENYHAVSYNTIDEILGWES